MSTYILKSTMLGLISIGIVSGCATVPTTANIDVSSKNITYFLRPGPGPTVVFQSGLGDGKDEWAKVIEKMPKSVSIFAYDRPGYGGSPNVSEPRDPCSISRELHELASKAGLKPPYILVGHSLGGLYQFCYAKLYPEDVAGLVLLDPTHPNHWTEMKKEAAVQAAIIGTLRFSLFSRAMRQEFDEQAGCIEQLEISRPLALPTKFLFSGQFKLAEKGAFEKMARGLRNQWLTFFSNSESSEVGGSGHYIQNEAPDTVVSAIQHVVTITTSTEISR